MPRSIARVVRFSLALILAATWICTVMTTSTSRDSSRRRRDPGPSDGDLATQSDSTASSATSRYSIEVTLTAKVSTHLGRINEEKRFYRLIQSHDQLSCPGGLEYDEHTGTLRGKVAFTYDVPEGREPALLAWEELGQVLSALTTDGRFTISERYAIELTLRVGKDHGQATAMLRQFLELHPQQFRSDGELTPDAVTCVVTFSCTGVPDGEAQAECFLAIGQLFKSDHGPFDLTEIDVVQAGTDEPPATTDADNRTTAEERELIPT